MLIGSFDFRTLILEPFSGLLWLSKFWSIYLHYLLTLLQPCILGGGILEDAVRETEVWMLNCLGFNLGLPLPQQFLRWARFADPTVVKKSAKLIHATCTY